MAVDDGVPDGDRRGEGLVRLRERRRTQDVQDAVLASAARLFARHGFARTTAKDIAEDAAVAETAIYRHFGSKQQLFAIAVVAPFERFAEQYAQKWWPVVDAGEADTVILRGFMEDLYDALRDNRDAVVALLAAQGDPAAQDAIEEGRRHFQHLFTSLTSLAEGRSKRSSAFRPVFTDEMTTRFIVGMLTVVTAFDTWFLPDSPVPSKRQIIDVMAGMVLPGLVKDGDGLSPTSGSATECPDA